MATIIQWKDGKSDFFIYKKLLWTIFLMKIHLSCEEWIIVVTLAGVWLLQTFHEDSETVK